MTQKQRRQVNALIKSIRLHVSRIERDVRMRMDLKDWQIDQLTRENQRLRKQLGK